MAEINLVPLDLKPSQGGLNTTRSIKKFITIAAVIFLSVTSIGVAVIIFLSNNVNASLAKQTSLTQSINSLESTEQKLFLVKDRINKIETIQTTTDAGESIKILKDIIFNLPNGVTVDTLDAGGGLSTKISVLSKDSLGMASFLNSLVVSGIYKKVVLTNFSFSPQLGFSIVLEGS